jgi:hypothetical protein
MHTFPVKQKQFPTLDVMMIGETCSLSVRSKIGDDFYAFEAADKERSKRKEHISI